MAQKVNPISLRLGYIRGWTANWFAPKEKFGDQLVADIKIRETLGQYIRKDVISKIIIERNLKSVVATIHTSKPGFVIGAGGAKIEELTSIIKKKCKEDVQINVFEVRRPELDATLTAQTIATQISGRSPFKMAARQAINNTMRAGAEGIIVIVSGRLGGAEIARSETYKEGRVPRHTLRADIDYASVRAETTYGTIGIKVFIFKRFVYGKRDLSLNLEVAGTKSGAPSSIRKKRGPKSPKNYR